MKVYLKIYLHYNLEHCVGKVLVDELLNAGDVIFEVRTFYAE